MMMMISKVGTEHVLWLLVKRYENEWSRSQFVIMLLTNKPIVRVRLGCACRISHYCLKY